MISLSTPRDPYDIELSYGANVTMRPLTTAGMTAAQAGARRRIGNIEGQVRERKESNLPLDGLPDLDDDAERDGLFHDLMIKELAARHITKWSGIEENPPVTFTATQASLIAR